MKALNKETAPKTQRPERIIQFGEGNFLRAFVDWIIYNIFGNYRRRAGVSWHIKMDVCAVFDQ